MNVEREVLTDILSLTKTGIVDYALLCKTSKIPISTAQQVVKRLEEQGLVSLQGKVLTVTPTSRVEMAIRAIKMGSDFESICQKLEWKEFENISRITFEAFNYKVIKNLRFKTRTKRRREIDLIAYKKPIIASVDCKHWQRNWTRSPIKKVVEQQIERTQLFTETLQSFQSKMKIGNWKKAIVIPIVLCLLPGPFKFHRQTPVVPVMKLQSFLNELPAHIDDLTYFTKNIIEVDNKITEY